MQYQDKAIKEKADEKKEKKNSIENQIIIEKLQREKESMKKISNSVRIGLVRRGSVSPTLNESQLSSKNQPPPNTRPIHPQFLNRRISRSAPLKADLHNGNGTNYGNQYHSNIYNSPSNPPSSLTAKQIETANLHEISSKAKWSRQKKILVGVSASILLGALIVVAVVLSVVLTRPAEITTTTSTTTVSPTIVSASWSFDNTPTDYYGVYNGQLVNSATYTPLSNSSPFAPYVGYGQELLLTSLLNQSFLVATPVLDLSYKSFTIEAWIYSPSSYVNDRGVFGQCQCPLCTNQCLYFIIRASHLYIGFTLNDLSGSLTVSINAWHHIAFVYNYQTQQQILYLDGVQDTIKSNAQPYGGTNGTIQIGSTQVFLTTNYFNGYIDNVKVVTRAKSSAEILNDASVTAYYSFDLPSPNDDSGPNGLDGTSVNTITVTGRVNQAMRFTGSSSYFRAYGFYQMPYGISASKPFSVSMWINPSSVASCTFVQLQTSTTSCLNMLGISSLTGSTGQIIAQAYNWYMNGPFLTAYTWTHISWTFSPINGYTLYVNGSHFGTIGSLSTYSSAQLAWLYIGYGISCTNFYSCSMNYSPFSSNSFIANTAYQGSIDEIYIHNRELTLADVITLANP